jgi:hypothetical protein
MSADPQQGRRVPRIDGQGPLELPEPAGRAPLPDVDDADRHVRVVGMVAGRDRPLCVASGRPGLRWIVDAQIAVQVREQARWPLVCRTIVELPRDLQRGEEDGEAPLRRVVAQRPLQRVDRRPRHAPSCMHDSRDEHGVVVVGAQRQHLGRQRQRRRISSRERHLGQREDGLGVIGRGFRLALRQRLRPVEITGHKGEPGAPLLGGHSQNAAAKLLSIEPGRARVVAHHVVAERPRRGDGGPEEAPVHPGESIERDQQHDDDSGDDQ